MITTYALVEDRWCQIRSVLAAGDATYCLLRVPRDARRAIGAPPGEPCRACPREQQWAQRQESRAA